MYNFYNLPKYIELNDDEIKNCFKEIKNGNMEIRNFVIKNNLRLVSKISKKFQNTDIEIEELIAIGSIGLIKAVDNYDIDRNIKFATFAARCIENEILMYLRKNKKTINTISLESEVTNIKTGDSFNLGELIKDDNADTEKPYSDYETNMIIYEILDTLEDRERKIIEMYFGFNLDKPYTQKDIAKAMNISQSYVCRIVKKVIKKFKNDPKTKSLVLTLYK